MKDSGIQLRGEETEALAIVFGDWQRDVDYQKWWRSLGVNPPGDYTDPELLFDQLPQPYRTITKESWFNLLMGFPSSKYRNFQIYLSGKRYNFHQQTMWDEHQ